MAASEASLVASSSFSSAARVGSNTWLTWLPYARGYAWLVPVDEEFIADTFNLYGLRDYPRYRDCMALIRGPAPCADSAGFAMPLFPRALALLSQIHSRFIVTTRGLTLMTQLFEDGVFGRCPRALCRGSPMLPWGPAQFGVSAVELYCPRCQERYTPHHTVPEAELDGAFFGPTFSALLPMMRPSLIYPTLEAHRPTIFGFAVAGQAGRGCGGSSDGAGGGAGGAAAGVWSGRRNGMPLTTAWRGERRPPEDDFYSEEDEPPPPPKEAGKKRALPT